MKTINNFSALKFLLLSGAIFTSSVFGTQEVKASTLVLDNFDTTPTQSTFFTNTGVPFGVPDTSVPPQTQGDSDSFDSDDVIGGFREFEHFLFDNSGGNVTPAGSTIGGDTEAGTLLIFNAPEANSTFTLIYDADTAGLGLDLLSGGFDTFSLELISTDLPVNFEISVTDSLGNISSVSEAVDLADSGEDILLPFVNLEPTDLAAADLSDIQSISLVITGEEAFDLVIDNFTVEGAVVPEPTTVLGLLTLAGFFVTSKRKKSIK